MRRSPLGLALLSLSGWCLFVGVLVDRRELFLIAVPLLGAVLSARTPAGPADIRTSLQVSATRVSEGDPLTATVTVASSTEIPLLEILLPLPPNIVLANGCNRVAVRLLPGVPLQRTFCLRTLARGRSKLGNLHLRLTDHSGLAVREAETECSFQIEVFPARVAVRQLPSPLRPRSSFGNYVSPRMGEGLEPGGIRPFTSGDRVRHINWRASLRVGRLHVTEYHEERNADVVLLLDTYAEAGGPAGTTLDATVRAAAALAAGYLARRDRVGLVELGGQLRWIRPTSGRAHLESVLHSLMPADVIFTYVVRHLNVIPPRVLPPRALVIAITPLLDQRFIDAVKDLAARRFDVLVLAVSPIEVTRRTLPPSRVRELAYRLWVAERRNLLDDLRRSGVIVADWEPTAPLESALIRLGRRRAKAELAI
jgi:uncharacterized protein (DUF58 family)